MKNILLISYSQTGQLHEITNNLCSNLTDSVETIHIKCKKPFNFPWSGKRFFNAMPESVLEIGQELESIQFNQNKYDLIILGYQPWYLSPSIPTTSLLDLPDFQEKLKDTPVVTVIGARNMWLSSQERIKERINSYGGHLVGNIPFCDKSNNFLSAISIVHWMLNGKKEKPFGLFPKPGISDHDIERGKEVGVVIQDWLSSQENHPNLQKSLNALNIYTVGTNLMFIESRAKKLFGLWAKLIRSKGKTEKSRQFYVTLFKYYLIIALFGIAPIVLTIYTIFVRPFIGASIKKKKDYFYGAESN